jgi:hypothetical protein
VPQDASSRKFPNVEFMSRIRNYSIEEEALKHGALSRHFVEGLLTKGASAEVLMCFDDGDAGGRAVRFVDEEELGAGGDGHGVGANVAGAETVGVIDDHARTRLVVDLECALHENLVEWEGQGIDGQICGRARAAAVHYERKRNIAAGAKACYVRCTRQRGCIALHACSCDLPGHVHGIHRELAAMCASRSLRRKCKTIELARDTPSGLFGVECYGGNHRNKIRRSCAPVNDRRACTTRD